MTAARYVCAFRGRRDSYQVPLALAEAGQLDQLITDAYAVPVLKALASAAPERLRASVASREEPGIPAERVKSLWATTLLEHARHRLGFDPASTWGALDPRFSRAAARRAARTRSDLLLYSPYAWEAFTAPYPHSPRRCLFQYHPHPDTEDRVLARRSGAPARDRDPWRHADLIVCASSFTRDSLLEAGAAAAKCRVVPYGIDVPAPVPGDAREGFHALFVGSDGYRKGLDRLLEAWKGARLPAASTLTLVCRSLAPGLAAAARATAGVSVLTWASPAELARLYASSTLFVMPSLAEGFGQVYLEALSHGCPVLGTPNTALPDLGGEADGVYVVPAGDTEQLRHQLEALGRRLPADPATRAAARACAARFTWPAFRAGLREALAA